MNNFIFNPAYSRIILDFSIAGCIIVIIKVEQRRSYKGVFMPFFMNVFFLQVYR